MRGVKVQKGVKVCSRQQKPYLPFTAYCFLLTPYCLSWLRKKGAAKAAAGGGMDKVE